MMPLGWRKKPRLRKALGLLKDIQILGVTKGHTEVPGEEASGLERVWGSLHLNTGRGILEAPPSSGHPFIHLPVLPLLHTPPWDSELVSLFSYLLDLPQGTFQRTSSSSNALQI